MTQFFCHKVRCQTSTKHVLGHVAFLCFLSNQRWGYQRNGFTKLAGMSIMQLSTSTGHARWQVTVPRWQLLLARWDIWQLSKCQLDTCSPRQLLINPRVAWLTIYHTNQTACLTIHHTHSTSCPQVIPHTLNCLLDYSIHTKLPVWLYHIHQPACLTIPHTPDCLLCHTTYTNLPAWLYHTHQTACFAIPHTPTCLLDYTTHIKLPAWLYHTHQTVH